MATLHVSNIVRNYDSWKGNFDKFEEAPARTAASAATGSPAATRSPPA